MKKTTIAIFAIILISIVISAYFFPKLPDKLASHWNAIGEVDGYMPKLLGLFLIPFILIVLVLFFILIPKIDPLKNNIEKFRIYYDGFIFLFCLFMLAVQIFIILWNLGIQINTNIFFPFSIALLFFYLGILCENSKRNWFIGIRTPWTLSSDKVWSKTHKLGGKLFRIIALITIAGIFFQKYTIYFILSPVLLATIYLFIYSYFEYKKEKK